MKRADRPASPFDAEFLKSGFDPSQPRDSDGKWTETGAQEAADVAHYAREASAAAALNGNLREGRALSPGQERMRQALEKSIAQAGASDTPRTVYRGAALPNEKVGPLLDALGRGRRVELTLLGFQSTSLEYSVAASSGLNQPGKRQVVFQIETRRGARLYEVSPHKSEREILLGHAWTYEVTGHGTDNAGRMVLRLRETGVAKAIGKADDKFFQPADGIIISLE